MVDVLVKTAFTDASAMDARCDLLPASAVFRRSQPRSDVFAQPTCTVLIEPRGFFRECVLASLTGLHVSAEFQAFETVEDWASSPHFERTDLLLFWLSVQQGELAITDCMDQKLARVRSYREDMPVVVMSDQEDVDLVVKTMRSGVQGFIPTSLSLEAAVKVFDLVRAGGSFIPVSCLAAASHAETASTPAAAELAGLFSPKQLAVTQAIRKGMPNKLIAYHLNMCESTVKVHVRTIMKKLKARNRTQIAFLTQNLGSED